MQGAALASGAQQVVEFMLPLFAGAMLDLSPAETGLLLAIGQLVSFLTRPLSGIVVDRWPRALVAAGGATTIGSACLGFAAANGMPIALLSSAACGAGSAFAWVAVRAIVGERVAEDSGVFARLLSAEESGGWIVLVPAVVLFAAIGYRWIFLGVGLLAFAAAGLLASAPRRPERVPGVRDPGEEPANLTRGLARRLYPMLLAVALTMCAEGTVGLLLVLHLQRDFALDVVEIALVFLPGAIAMSVVPGLLHRIVVRYGRTRVLAVSAVASAAFAAALALAPNPGTVAALWVASAVAWSAIIPIEQAVVAEVAGTARLGRGLGLYEAACLAGALVGSAAAGVLFETTRWALACVGSSLVILGGAVLVPAAVRRLGVADRPAPARTDPGTVSPAPGTSAPPHQPDTSTTVTRRREPKTRRQLLIDLAAHMGLLAGALIVGWLVIPEFTLPALVGIGPARLEVYYSVQSLWKAPLDWAALIATALRIWVAIFLIDLVWTTSKCLPRRTA